MELVPGCGFGVVFPRVGCLVAETHGYGSGDPTLAAEKPKVCRTPNSQTFPCRRELAGGASQK